MNKPLLIYVSGSPGSGKTTLAKLLSDYLCIPHVSSDLVHGGVAYSGNTISREKTLHEVFVPLLIKLSQQGVSFVVDQVLQKNLSEKDIIDKIKTHAVVVNIHTQTADPLGRYVKRNDGSPSPIMQRRRQELRDRVEYHRTNLVNTDDPLDLGVALLTVKTDDGYEPELEKIVSFVNEAYKSNPLQ